jgi:hypothetical protein
MDNKVKKEIAHIIAQLSGADLSELVVELTAEARKALTDALSPKRRTAAFKPGQQVRVGSPDGHTITEKELLTYAETDVQGDDGPYFFPRFQSALVYEAREVKLIDEAIKAGKAPPSAAKKVGQYKLDGKNQKQPAFLRETNPDGSPKPNLSGSGHNIMNWQGKVGEVLYSTGSSVFVKFAPGELSKKGKVASDQGIRFPAEFVQSLAAADGINDALGNDRSSEARQVVAAAADMERPAKAK